MPKRIRINLEHDVESPNGFKISFESIDFTKFNENPHLLKSHDWSGLPLGKVVEIKNSRRGVYGTVIFHKQSDDSKMISKMANKGMIKLLQPGGYPTVDAAGNISKFDLYELSICI